MNYIDVGNTLPVPFNMVPSVKSLRYFAGSLQQLVRSNSDESKVVEHQKSQSFIKVHHLHSLCQLV